MEFTRYLDVFDKLSDGVYIFSSDAVVLYVNPQGGAILGISDQELIGKRFIELFPETDYSKLVQNKGACINFELHITRKNISGILVRFCTKTDLEPSPFLIILQNVHMGFLPPNQFHSIFESSNDGIFITDGNGVVLMVNSSYEQITGNTRADVVGKHVKELVTSGYFSESATLEILKTKKKATIIPKLKNKRDVMVTGSPVFGKEGEIVMVVINVRDMSELKALQRELLQAKALGESCIEKKQSFNDLVINSPLMQDIVSQAKQIAPFPTSVFISGETGVGKEVIANFIQQNSDRADKPYLKINCGSIPENLLESELYGYEAGAFTGASKSGKIGIIELANGGTLLLDEIGELPLNLQVKLLRFLQERQITRIGGTHSKMVDVRIISATNRNIEELTRQNLFRSDLFYRLNVVNIKVPPLRERIEDIVPLANLFLTKFCNNYNLTKSFSEEIIQYFLAYDWPGNIRELRNLVENLTVSSHKCVLDPLNLPNNMIGAIGKQNLGKQSGSTLKDILEHTEKSFIVRVLEAQGGIRSSARILGIDHATLLRKMKKYGIVQ
ncbi:MAG: sigma 54-interacting transcriptional regulator [Sphaerochaeta sp.]|nr:sigma 54-interacting transcriptional regulator [Sphaerochaeta sp.]